MKTNVILLVMLPTMALGCGGGDPQLQSDATAEAPPTVDSAVQTAFDAATPDTPALDTSVPHAGPLDTARGDSMVDDVSPEAMVGQDGERPVDADRDGSTPPLDAQLSGCNTATLGPAPPLLLRDTGCFELGLPKQPIADFMPYEVNSPLWSDGATKERYLKVPPGTTIAVKDCDLAPDTCLPVARGGRPEDEGHFDLPVGSILIKVFSLEGRRIETRLLMRVSDSAWKAYSYQWNESETEATLSRDGGDRTVGSQTWHYPSEGECTQCHTLAAGRSLGTATQQLDRTTTAGNQLDLLLARGWLAARPKALPPLPDPRISGPAEGRARSYLQANCSFCHRPGTYISDMDMRYVTKLLDMNVCNVPIQRGLGFPEVPQLRVVPGKPAESALSFRMHDRVAGYTMPRIGSNLVDPTGTMVVDQWLSELTGCPTASSP
jgi:uncharacterized repeat protein (TIGR03806 family)